MGKPYRIVVYENGEQIKELETNHVQLCKGCIEMLKEHNPYKGTCYTVKEVPMEQCDNYTDDTGHFMNLEKRYGKQP